MRRLLAGLLLCVVQCSIVFGQLKVPVDKTTEYSPAFVSGLQGFSEMVSEVRDGGLYLKGEDEAYFIGPRLPTDDTIRCSSASGFQGVIRTWVVNRSTVGFEITSSVTGSSYAGRADLSPGFFLGEETDDSNGIPVQVDEYHCSCSTSSWASLRFWEGFGRVEASPWTVHVNASIPLDAGTELLQIDAYFRSQE